MSNKLYTTIPAPKVPRNVFNLSRYNSLTMPYQRVCPTAVQEIVPGDKFFWSAEVFCRTAPMVAPVMTDQKLSLHAFFVPLRTVNSHFAEFMFNNKSGNYTDVLPYTTLEALYKIVDTVKALTDGLAQASDIIRLYDYIGLPFSYRSAATASGFVTNWLSDNSALSSSQVRINLAPFIAYTKVWSEYFRDENLVEDPFDTWTGYGYSDVLSLTGKQSWVSSGGSLSTPAYRFALCFMKLRPRAWQHDRFTSSLPFAQRGPDVLLPVTGTFDVTQDGPSQTGSVAWNGDQLEVTESVSGDIHDLDLFGEIDGISTTINDFRRAERLQRWYENSARGGVRPNEATLAHFGVRTPDSTLDRAEFLGGTMQPIVVSEVAQTSETTQTGTPQGTLAGKGTSYKSGGLFKHFFTEHGFVFVFASALIRPAYWQGVPRVFSRMQRDEYYWPEFALLGEEPVFDKELYVDANTTEDGVFGYVPRYSDYKSALPEVHGDFRTSLDYWVNPRKFGSKPALNAEFIFGNPQKKQYAVTSDYTDSLLVTIRHGVKASRLMPFYGVPTI